MSPEEQCEVIPVNELKDKVAALRQQGCRLVQISATSLADKLELTYSFDLQGRLLNLRLQVPLTDRCVPSITSIYWCAFIYENEMHDLFNLQVTDMAVDFQGKFYQTAVKHPFGTGSMSEPKVVSTATGSSTSTGPGQSMTLTA